VVRQVSENAGQVAGGLVADKRAAGRRYVPLRRVCAGVGKGTGRCERGQSVDDLLLAGGPLDGTDISGSQSAAVFGHLAHLAPAINNEVAWFLPKSIVSAAAGLGVGALIGKAVGLVGGMLARSGTAAEETVTLFRGVASDHLGFERHWKAPRIR
jgi:hypothetical protein